MATMPASPAAMPAHQSAMLATGAPHMNHRTVPMTMAPTTAAIWSGRTPNRADDAYSVK